MNTRRRHGELLALRSDWLNWEKNEVALPAEVTKGEKPRIIPFDANFAGTLKDYCARALGDHVFTHGPKAEPFSTFQNFFKAACRRAGVKNARFHDLRHTFGSWWVQDGGDLYVLKDLMGHSTIQTTERYAHLNSKTTRRAVDELRGTLEGTQ